MKRQTFNEPNAIVNVALVPQLSPFRYPGGKTWLVPRIRQWLRSLPARPVEFIEPFAGGGIVGLTVAFENLAAHVTLVELDDQVAAVWRVILCGDAECLAQRIVTFELTPESVDAVLSQPAQNVEDKAFQTILKNRVNRGGILAPGAGRVKRGENGKGLRSRWYPRTLKKRILDIAIRREQINFVEADGIEVLAQHARHADTVFFIDPPYTAAGKKAGARLYTHFQLDHEELFRVASRLAGDFLMTYENAEGVRDLARMYDFDMLPIAMKSTHHAEMLELLIGRNLDWARQPNLITQENQTDKHQLKFDL
jgi:DNA adenine methylase